MSEVQKGSFLLKVKNLLKNSFPILATFYINIKYFLKYRNGKEILVKPHKQGNEIYHINTKDLVIGSKILLNGSFEFEKVLKVLRLIKKKALNYIFIDIGANIGTTCIPAIRRGLFKKCIAIEPDPYNFRLLKKNININGIDSKIRIINTALGSVNNKKAIFELSKHNFGDHRIRNDNIFHKKNYYLENQRKTINVKLTKLDNILKKINPKKIFLWIDVQGYEGFVLDGGKKTLSHNPPLVIEFWPYALERSGCLSLLKEIIINANYNNCYDLSRNVNLGKLSSKKFDKIKSRYSFEGKFNSIKCKMLGKSETDLFFYN